MCISNIYYQNKLKISLKGSIRVPVYYSQGKTGSKVALGYQFTIPKLRQGLRSRRKPVESGSPLGWPAVGGQLGLAVVSLLHSLS
jgi:hypothetical protein